MLNWLNLPAVALRYAQFGFDNTASCNATQETWGCILKWRFETLTVPHFCPVNSQMENFTLISQLIQTEEKRRLDFSLLTLWPTWAGEKPAEGSCARCGDFFCPWGFLTGRGRHLVLQKPESLGMLRRVGRLSVNSCPLTHGQSLPLRVTTSV